MCLAYTRIYGQYGDIVTIVFMFSAASKHILFSINQISILLISDTFKKILDYDLLKFLRYWLL